MPNATPPPPRVFAASLGFLGPSAQARRIRRILDLAGHKPKVGWPQKTDAVLAWGHSPRAYRAEALALRTGAPIWRVEDAFLRSIHPGRDAGEPPAGLLLDRAGVHYDPSTPSDLETLLAKHPLDDGALLARARVNMDRLRHLHLSKYNAFDPDLPPPEPGYVLVIDQVKGDASITHGRVEGMLPADRLFREMLVIAQEEHPGARILIRAHPETTGGHRTGHYARTADNTEAGGRVSFIDGPHSPWTLMEGAVAVFTVSSQLGFEAILAGHKPRVFGQPFYAGWGLTQDQNPQPRRRRVLTRAQLFAGAMMLYPLWYDPLRDRLCELEEVINQLEARLRCYRQDRAGHTAVGMRLWKRAAIQAFFGQHKAVKFAKDAAPSDGRSVIGWASAVSPDFDGLRVEDGFLRSRGLGADLVPPLSLVADDLGIYYDPNRESRLERLIAGKLPPGGAERAQDLRRRILDAGVTKYNLATQDTAAQSTLTELRAARPDATVVLVPGQVEDDASIRLGTDRVTTNRGLLEAAREALPDAILVYKPHPDVEAGLRPGRIEDAETLADLILPKTDAAQALAMVDQVWTMTSGLGFEALLRGVPVTCLGAPYYTGWGLTTDRGTVPDRRRQTAPRPDLDQLVHAVLIAYPRYLDPLTNTPCPPELIVERLASGRVLPRSLALRLLAKLQGALAGFAWIWR